MTERDRPSRTLVERLADPDGSATGGVMDSIRRSVADILAGPVGIAGDPGVFTGALGSPSEIESVRGSAYRTLLGVAGEEAGPEVLEAIAARIRRQEPRLEPASIQVRLERERRPGRLTLIVHGRMRGHDDTTVTVRLRPVSAWWRPSEGSGT